MEQPEKETLCIIYNTAPRYREAIFKMIDKEYDCNWYFGPTRSDIKEMDVSVLRHVKYYEVSDNPYRKHGVLKLLFCKSYQRYLYLAESRCVTDYLFIAFARLFFRKKKVYIWTHGFYGKESRVETLLKKWMYGHVDGVFLYGHYAKQLMIERGMNADRLHVIHNSLHYDEQLALRSNMTESNIYKKHFNNSNPTIIFIGRLTRIKRLDMLIDSMAALIGRGECYNLVLIGDGEARESLEKTVEEKKLGKHVWFYGGCYDEKANAELIFNADLCVAPGNVGLTAMHSMVFGCPVISHDDFAHQMPEFEAISKGITGDFFKYGDTVSLADTISKWFNNPKYDREEVRQACFRVIDKEWNPHFQMEVLKKHIK